MYLVLAGFFFYVWNCVFCSRLLLSLPTVNINCMNCVSWWARAQAIDAEESPKSLKTGCFSKRTQCMHPLCRLNGEQDCACTRDIYCTFSNHHQDGTDWNCGLCQMGNLASWSDVFLPYPMLSQRHINHALSSLCLQLISICMPIYRKSFIAHSDHKIKIIK